MKRVLLSITVLSLLAGIASTSTEAITPPSNERGYISVNTSANTELAPDVAEITIAIQTNDSKSMQKATIQNKEISEKVLSALKSMINPAKGDFVKTADYNATPIYSYNAGKQTFDKYQVSNSVIIHTSSIDKVGSIIDKAISLGATNVNSLAFSVSKYDDQCNELLSIATKKAQNQADFIAKAASTTVSGIRSMDVSCSANNVRPQFRMYNAKNVAGEMADMATGTSIEEGVIKIYANVSASFFVR